MNYFTKSTLTLATIAILAALTPTPVAASCGMGVCPLPVAGGLNERALSGTGVLPSQLALETRFVSFDIGGRGSYVQNALTGVYEHRVFRAGAILPAIYLSGPQGNTFGLGNTTLFGELYIFTRPGTRVSIGSQVETPTGNHDKGLGAGHFMAIPYLNWWQQVSDVRFAVQAGAQQVLGDHSHGAGGTPLYVNPHTDTELMARWMASYTWVNRYSAETMLHLRQAMGHDAVGDKTFLDLGFAFRAAFGDTWALRLGMDFPVLSRARHWGQVYAALFAYF